MVSCENNNESLGPIKRGEFPNQLTGCQSDRENSAPGGYMNIEFSLTSRYFIALRQVYDYDGDSASIIIIIIILLIILTTRVI
jgi:hypothetical protein